MEFLALAKRRHSTRKYLSTPVEREKLEQILEAGRSAPTACNNQPQRVLVAQSPKALEKLAGAYRDMGAPLALIVCADHSQSWKREGDGMDSAHIDASIVTDHMMLCATALGLRTLWVCAFRPDVLRAGFDLPEHIEPVNILYIGYSERPEKEAGRHREQRKALEETVVYL